MNKVVIYEFQLRTIESTLCTISRIMQCRTGDAAIDRSVVQSLAYARNALDGKSDLPVGRFQSQQTEAEVQS